MTAIYEIYVLNPDDGTWDFYARTRWLDTLERYAYNLTQQGLEYSIETVTQED